jgi:hypothetical protein
MGLDLFYLAYVLAAILYLYSNHAVMVNPENQAIQCKVDDTGMMICIWMKVRRACDCTGGVDREKATSKRRGN